MKKLHKVLSVVVGIILALQSTSSVMVVNASTIVSGPSVDFELLGNVNSPVISVIMPTKVEFAITPGNEGGWNKMLSPVFSISNVGTVTVNISISKAVINSSNVEFTVNTPTAEFGIRQVRIGIAPDQSYSTIEDVRNYLFTNSVSVSNPIALASNLDYSLTNNTRKFKVYGDISTGWGYGENLSISTVFRITLS